MAEDLTKALAAQGVAPQELGVTAEEPTGAEPNPAAVAAIRSTGAAPPALANVTAELGGLAAAGVDLAKLTMIMMSAALAFLVIMLIQAENTDSAATRDLNSRLMAFVVEASDRPAANKSAPVAGAFREAAQDSSRALTAAETASARALIGEALQNPQITPAQRSALQDKCLPLPAADSPDRASVLQGCATTLETIFADSASLAQRVTFLQAAQKALAETEAARRAFWLQVAQLVLINLLLPILTGLLGYIFGTQQGQK